MAVLAVLRGCMTPTVYSVILSWKVVTSMLWLPDSEVTALRLWLPCQYELL